MNPSKRETLYHGTLRLKADKTLINAYVRLHPEIPIFPLPRLVHLRIPLLVPVLGRAGRVQDGGVHNMAWDYWKVVAGHSVQPPGYIGHWLRLT